MNETAEKERFSSINGSCLICPSFAERQTSCRFRKIEAMNATHIPKLIETSLPLEAINEASAREKSIRHGHPSTLHLWWARRPLASARAVIFASMVYDPLWKYGEHPTPQQKSAATKKREELKALIAEMVKWESTTNEKLFAKAHEEILESWREICEANGWKDNPPLPAFHDPFAGGGALPLEGHLYYPQIEAGLRRRGADNNGEWYFERGK